jgi:hypothetical protein
LDGEGIPLEMQLTDATPIWKQIAAKYQRLFGDFGD